MIQKKTANTISNHNQKILCLIIIITLLIPISLGSSSTSKINNNLALTSSIYHQDDAEIYLTETTSDDGYTIDLEFSISDYKSETILINGDNYLSLTIGESITSTAEEGKPRLPTINKLIAIPYDSTYSLEVLNSEYKNIKLGQKLIPVQAELYDYENINNYNNFVIDRLIYETDDFYSKNTASIITHGVFRDFQIILLQINPISYNPIRDEIKFYNKLDVRLEFDKKPMRIRESEMQNDIYKGIILNYDKAKNWPTYKDSPADGYDYLIITDDSFYDSLTPLKQNREAFGITTNIVKTSETGTSSTAIRDYIKDEYNNQGISYVLLVGDVDGIPIKDTGDHYYTLLDGNDLYPEIAIGRFSVKNEQEINKIVSKTVGYTTASSNDDGWEKNILLVAHPQDAPGKYQGCKETIANDIISSEMTVNKVYPYEGHTKQDAINYINQGQLIVNYRGHGSVKAWDNPSIGISDLTSLNNAGKLPVIFSISCLNGQIDSECIAEKSHRDEASCIAYLGASRPSATYPNHDFDKDLFRAIYNKDITILGDVVKYAKVELLKKWPSGGGPENTKMYILLGDPTIDLQRTGPKLSYSPTSHDFKEKEKGITDSTSFEIWNSNTETLTFSLSTECNWVSISPESGSSTEGEKKTINVTIDTSNLDYGINNCDINIESDGGTTGVFEVSVNVVSRKPDVPTNPDPANGSTGVDNNPFLKIDVSDPDNENMNVTFYNAKDNNKIGEDNNVASGGTATTQWENLENGKTYKWYAKANDGFTETTSDTYTFTTNSPPTFSNIYPTDQATDIPAGIEKIDITINDPDNDNYIWSITTDPDIGSNSGNTNTYANQDCYVSNLQPKTQYTWTVEAADEKGATTKKTYSFTTKENTPPNKPNTIYPLNNTQDISIICTLNWTCTDPDQDTLTYTIYFGQNSNPEPIIKDITTNQYTIPYDLKLDTNYYWKIQATDPLGETSESTIWSFHTSPDPPPPQPGSIDINFPRRFFLFGKVKADLQNIGIRDASNVNWTIKITGGIRERINITKDDTIKRLNQTEDTRISSHKFLELKTKAFGFGKVKIEVIISNDDEIVNTESREARIIGPLIMLLD